MKNKSLLWDFYFDFASHFGSSFIKNHFFFASIHSNFYFLWIKKKFDEAEFGVFLLVLIWSFAWSIVICEYGLNDIMIRYNDNNGCVVCSTWYQHIYTMIVITCAQHIKLSWLGASNKLQLHSFYEFILNFFFLF